MPWPDGELVAGLDPLGFAAARPPTAWVPDTTVPLDEALPVPWAITSVTLDLAFNPYVYRLNAGMLCAATEAHPEWEPMLEEIAVALVGRLLDHSAVVDGARFVEYRFPYEYEDLQLESPWVSAFGNAEAVLGTIALDRCWPTTRLDGVIAELLRAFERTEDDGAPWFRRDLTDGVWFEEIAVPGAEVMVLNGHLQAVLALYYAWDREPGERRIEGLVHGGIRATLVHLPSYRRRGEVLCYDLTPPCHPDYGPVRTINQLDALARIAPESALQSWADLLADDLSAATIAPGSTAVTETGGEGVQSSAGPTSSI